MNCKQCSRSVTKNSPLNPTFIRRLTLFIIGTVLLISGFVLAKTDTVFASIEWSYLGNSDFYSSQSFKALIIYSLAYLILLSDLIKGMVEEIKEGEIFNEYLLMLFATAGAFGLGEFPEAILVILLNIIGESLEDYATDKSKESIKGLVNSMPLFAHVVGEDGKVKDEDPKNVKIGTLLEIKPGEKVAIDSIIYKGSSSFDLSSINGESLPREIKEGDEVYSGSINNDSLIIVRTKRLYQDSTLKKVMDLVENEQAKKSKSERFLARFSKYYTPIVITIAFLVFIVGYGLSGFVFEGADNGEGYLYKALSILLIACPCSLLISVPIAYFAGIGKASKMGVLIKGGLALETLGKSKEFVFDKTGTLTKGTFALKNSPNSSYLQIAASLESKSTHPLSKALVQNNRLPLSEVTDLTNIQGYGIEGKINDKEYYIGSKAFLESKGIRNIEVPETPYKVIYLSDEKMFLEYFIVADEIKEDAKDALSDLKTEGARRTIMLSGDDEKIAQEVGKEIGIDSIHGELLPEDKLQYVLKYKEEGKLCYVGDGINDSPAILSADVGIAMGGLGSDAAIEASDIVIMNDDLKKLAETKRLAKKVTSSVIFNIVFSLAVKSLVMVLVTLGYFDGFAMIIGTLSDTGLMVLCTLNSLKIIFSKEKYIKED